MGIGDGGPVPREQASRGSIASRPSSWLDGSRRWWVALAIGGIAGVVLVVRLFWLIDQRDAPAIVIEDVAADATVVVSVEGRVATPGVYELEPGSRIGNALDAAGGVLPDADLSSINRAARLRDGDRIIVPSAAGSGSTVPIVATEDAGQAPPEETNGLAVTVNAGTAINLNTATAAELESLPGIGPAKAEAIIAFRNEHGPFQSVDDLAEVEGISDAMVDDLRPLVRV